MVPAVEPRHEESAPPVEPFFESVGPVVTAVEPQQPEKSAPVAEPFFESVGPVIEQAPEAVSAVAPQETGLDGSEPGTEFAESLDDHVAISGE